MASPRALTKPPITEALLDIRAEVAWPQETFEAFAKEFSPDYPTIRFKRGIKTLRIEAGKLVPPRSEEVGGFQGIRVENQDGTVIAQFRPDGFTLNNVKKYTGGDRLISTALSLWSRFLERAKPTVVSRVGLRYINQLDLPLQERELMKKYLVAPPELPTGAPQLVSEFLARIVGHNLEQDFTAIVTQRLQPDPKGPRVLIDVDVFKQGEFSVAPDALRPVLESIRVVAKNTFFALLTDEAVALYL